MSQLKRILVLCVTVVLILVAFLFNIITLGGMKFLNRGLLSPVVMKDLRNVVPFGETTSSRSKMIHNLIRRKESQTETIRRKHFLKKQVPIQRPFKKQIEFAHQALLAPIITRGSLQREYSVLFYNPKYYAPFLSDKFSKPCKHSNCKFVHNKTNVANVDAVIIEGVELSIDPPVERKKRRPGQMWIMFGQESPVNYYEVKLQFPQWRDVFNWTMTYHGDADFPVPYGAFIKSKKVVRKNYTYIFHKKTKYVAWIVSNCERDSGRWDFVQKLKKYIKVDIYGLCGNVSCDSNKTENACFDVMKDYKFYLSFENSLCKEYVTEKLFEYINHDIIPVVRGGANYDIMFPPGVFINTRHFGSIEMLGKYLNILSNDEKSYTAFLKRKNLYDVKGLEFGYQNAFCKLCSYLNDRRTFAHVYHNISDWLYANPAHSCHVPDDLK